MRHARSSLVPTIRARATQRLAKRVAAAVRPEHQDDLPRVVIRMAWTLIPSFDRLWKICDRPSERLKKENPQARGAAASDSKARSAASFSSVSGRKIIQTPARTKQAPRSDQAENHLPRCHHRRCEIHPSRFQQHIGKSCAGCADGDPEAAQECEPAIETE